MAEVLGACAVAVSAGALGSIYAEKVCSGEWGDFLQIQEYVSPSVHALVSSGWVKAYQVPGTSCIVVIAPQPSIACAAEANARLAARAGKSRNSVHL